MPDFGSYQMPIYLGGLTGEKPPYPMTFAELAAAAEQRMTADLWSYVAGGAGAEHTQDGNVAAFRGWGLMPRMLRTAAERDLRVELFGRSLDSPLLIAPIGVLGLCDPEGHGDLATARAGSSVGVPMIASTLGVDPLEDVAAACGSTPHYFQLYPPRNRELAQSFVRRAEAAGYAGIVMTLDTWILGWRPRDLAMASFPQLRGLCLANYFTDPVFRSLLPSTPEDDPRSATMLWSQVFGDPTLRWEDVAWLRSLTDLPIVLKGICDPDDARRAIDLGADGVYCSNHGGRQADGGLPALDVLAEVVDASGGAPVIFDSGIRSGSDVVKALALGATAVAVGRPLAYGLAVGGQAGAEHVLRCLLAEADLLMAIDGYRDISELTRDALRPVGRH